MLWGMTKSAAYELVVAIDTDPTLRRLRDQQSAIEAKLATTQREIADAHAQLQASRAATGVPMSPEDYLATLERPVATVEALRDLIRQKRLDEGQYSEGLRTLRLMISRRENGAFYEHLPVLQREQLKIGGRVLDTMITLCQQWLEERALHAPLKTISKFEAADCWCSHVMTPAMIREKLRHLEQRGYQATPDQLHRLDALEALAGAES